MGLAMHCAAALAVEPLVLRIGNGIEPESLDPHKAEGVSALNVLRDLFEGLTSVSPAGEVVPGAAQSWERSDDGLSWTFHLRPEARWSNGDALVAEDFVAGLRRSADPQTGSNFSQILAPIAGATDVIAGRAPPGRLAVEALDERTLHITLGAPAPYLPGLLAHAATYPVHRPSLAQFGAGFARPGKLVSNGAYSLREWVVNSHVALARNPQYWNNRATHVDRVVYYPTEDLNSELKRYRAGELDVTFQAPLVQAKWIRENLGGELHLATYLGTYYLGFNVTRPPFRDSPKLRRALSMAIDREVIVGKVMNGLGRPAFGWVPPGIANYTPQQALWAAWPRDQRLAEAQRLYREAGYSAAHPLEVEIRYNTHEDHKRIAVVVAAMWKQWLGVRARLVNEESRVFLHHRKLRQVTQVFRASWVGDYDDASTFLDVLTSTHGKNDTGWSNARYDALVAQAAAQADPRQRQALLEEAERLLLEDAPLIPVYFYVTKHLVKPWVRGWQDNILDYHYAKDLEILAH